MKKFYSVVCAALAVMLTLLAAVCIFERSRSFPSLGDNTAMAAVALALPGGRYRDKATPSDASKADVSDEMSQNTAGALPVVKYSEVYKEDPSQYDGETHLPIYETQYVEGDVSYENISVKNTTGLNLDIEKYLGRNMGFKFSDDSRVQVLIVHTHTSESYLYYDAGYYHESFYPRSTDNSKNMVRVGEEIANSLRQQGIGVVHATEIHDNPRYNGAYYRSWDTIKKYLDEYPDIKVVLDIHRDSISYGSEGGKIKPTFEAGGRKGAQIMIMSGYDPDGSLEFPFWEDNLSFALKIQKKAEDMYPGMTRPLYFGNFAYNMNVNNGSLLIEVGTDANTLEEAVYTGGLLGNVLSQVLQSS